MFDISKELVLVQDVVDVIFSTICKIATRKPLALLEVPEAPAEGEEADFDDKVAEIKEANANAEAENAKYAKIQTKILINVRQEEDYNEENEKALVKLNNWRDTSANESAVLSARADSQGLDGIDAEAADQFDPDKIPPKILVTKPQISDTGEVVAMYHPEAAYQVRRVLMEAARKTFKELEKAEIAQLLLHSNQRSTMLENKFEEKFIR